MALHDLLGYGASPIRPLAAIGVSLRDAGLIGGVFDGDVRNRGILDRLISNRCAFFVGGEEG
ncbi:MAG: hypothetical protein ABL894_12400, partial [Hyphomicrobium sp.]